MATTTLTSSNEGFIDPGGSGRFFSSFVLSPVLTHALGVDYFAIYRFRHTGPNTTFWIDASTTTTPEFSLSLPNLGGNGYPFYLYVATRIDGDRDDYPTHDAVLDDEWNLDVYEERHLEPFPASGYSKGLLAAKKLIASDPGATLTVPLDMAAFIPAITHEDWTGYIYLTVWIRPATGGSASAQLFLDSSSALPPGTAASLLLPAVTLSVPNRDTGREAAPGAASPYRRCPVTGLAIQAERMVPDGYREGLMVHPDAWDPEEPEPRPDFSDITDWYEGT